MLAFLGKVRVSIVLVLITVLSLTMPILAQPHIEWIALSGEIRALDWSPDGKYLAVGVSVWLGWFGPYSGQLALFDYKGNIIWVNGTNLGYIKRVVFSPNGEHIAVLHSTGVESILTIYSMDGEVECSCTASTFSWCSDSDHFVVSTDNQLRLLKLSDLGFSRTYILDKDIETMEFSPSDYLAVGCEGMLKLYRLISSNLNGIWELELSSTVKEIDWCSSSKFVIGTDTGVVSKHTITSSTPEWNVTVFGSVSDLKVNPSSTYIAVATYNFTTEWGRMEVLLCSDSSLIYYHTRYRVFSRSVEWSPDGDLLAVFWLSMYSDHGEVRVYSVLPFGGVWNYPTYESVKMKWNPSTHRPCFAIGVNSYPPKLTILSTSGYVIWSYRLLDSRAICVEWDHTGYRVMVGDDRGYVTAYNRRKTPLWLRKVSSTFELLLELLLYSGSDRIIAVGTESVEAMYITSGRKYYRETFTNDVRDAATCLTQPYLVVGVEDEVYLYKIDVSPFSLKWSKSLSDVRCVDISPNGQYVAVGTHNKRIYWLRASDGYQLHAREVGEAISIVRFSPDSKYMIAIGDKHMYIWNLTSWHLKDVYVGRSMKCMDISPDSERIVVGTKEGYVYMYSMDGTKGFYYHYPGEVTSVQFNPRWVSSVYSHHYLAVAVSIPDSIEPSYAIVYIDMPVIIPIPLPHYGVSRYWSTKAGKVIHQVRWSPDGEFLAIASDGGLFVANVFGYSLLDFPLPFVKNKTCNVTFIIGDSRVHNHTGFSASTADFLQSLNLANFLGRNAKERQILSYLDTQFLSYDNETKKLHFNHTRFYELVKSPCVIVIGGPGVNYLTLYYNASLPFKWLYTPKPIKSVIYSTKTGNEYKCGKDASGKRYDHAIIATFYDWYLDKQVLVIWGLSREGTKAACWFLAEFPFLSGKAILIEWIDENKNNHFDKGDIIMIREKWP